MNAFSFSTFLFYVIIIFCKSSALCPCHIPCTNEPEICTCYGPCGDDGYGCKRNGEDHEFLDQIQCREREWQIQCIRRNKCSIQHTLDDTNPYAAYEQSANNLIESFDDDEVSITSSAWFGGNWFDFWGQNAEQFFSSDNAQTTANTNTNTKHNQQDDHDDYITIDSDDDSDSDTSQSSSRTLKHSKPSQKHILDDLGRNDAGYRIIALPLYVLIICIVSASLLGMLMCAGFVYCGLNCCCPLPPTSPILSAQQRNNAVDMSQVLQSLTLGGGGNKSYDTDYGHSVYARMRNALHNPTNDEASSILSNEVDDEYVDSEDDLKDDEITRGGDMDDYEETCGAGYNVVVMERRESFALNGKCESDIDNDSDDSMMERLSQLVVTQMADEDSYKDIDIEEERDDISTMVDDSEYDDDDDDPEILEGIDEMVTVENMNNDEEESAEEMEYTENEGTPLICENVNNSVLKSSALP